MAAPVGRYQADLSAGSLMLRESRRIAELLLCSPTDAEWDRAIKVENLLQKGTPSTAVRQARLIRFRLWPMGDAAWQMVANGDQEVASQTLFAAALLHSELLHDFVRGVLVSHHRRLDLQVQPREWDGFLTECTARDPSVSTWTASTRAKLLQVILRILVEAKYLESSRTLRLRSPSIHPQVRSLLQSLGHDELIKTMELQA
jgi:bacteriophage exclusion system BrxA-like protein